MKFEITKEWLEKRATKEHDEEPSAGFQSVENFARETNALRVTPKDQVTFRAAFGALINNLRVEQKLSTRKLAERAEIEESEVVAMETSAHYNLEPRIVYQLAQALKLAPKLLLQVSGLLIPGDAELRSRIERFATSARRVDHLSKEEHELLVEFVKFLAEREKNK